MSGHTAPPPHQEVAVRTPIFLVLVNGLYVFLQLVLQREPFTTVVAGQRLHAVSWVESGEMSVEVDRRGEGLQADCASVVWAAVAEGVLLQRARILERLSTGLADTELHVRVNENMPSQVAVGQEGGRADITGEFLLLPPADRMFELPVQPQVVFLGAAEAAVLADEGSLTRVSSGVDDQPRLLTEDLLTDFTGVALGVDQVLVLVPQLIGGKLLITELTEEYFLLLPRMISQLVVLTPTDCLERLLVVTAGKSAVEMILQMFVVLKLKHQLRLVILIINLGRGWTPILGAINHVRCLAFSRDCWSIIKATDVFAVEIIFQV